MDSENVGTQNGQIMISEDQSISSSKKWIEESIISIFSIALILVFPAIGAEVAFSYFNGLSKGIHYLYAFAVTFGVFGIIGAFLNSVDSEHVKTENDQMEISDVRSSVNSQRASFSSKEQIGEWMDIIMGIVILLVFSVIAAHVISYYNDRLSKGILYLCGFGISIVVFCIIGILFLLYVFLNKKYNNRRKVAIVNGKFHYEDLKKAPNNFRDKLGSGGSASVFKGILDDGTAVAVKRVERLEHGNREFVAEINAIGNVDHAHLVCLRGSCCHMTEIGEAFFIVYDLFPNGQRILHLDIKPENVLLDDDFRAIVSDFGLSKLMSKDESRTHITERGTYGYKAPEWVLPHGISEKCDIFGYGKLLLDIIFGPRYVCLNQDGNDIYRRYSDGGNTRREQRTFFAFMRKKLTQNNLLDLIDRRLVADGKVDENEVRTLVYVALCCLEEDPKKRPGDMRHVVDFLEEQKIEGITRIFPRVFPYKEYENQKNVDRFSREFRHKELEIATSNYCDKLGNGGSGHMTESRIISLFVYDFFPNGSLDDWIFPRRGNHSSYWGLRYKIAENVARALEYLHDQRILHLHIKPENILLDADFCAVVSDTGHSMLVGKDESRIFTTIRGTDGYMAPEGFLGDITEKCDVFSYGVLLLDMFFGKRNVCFDSNGNHSDKQHGNSQEERLKFYMYMRQEVLSKGKALELIDKRLDLVNKREARSLLKTALQCVQEDPKERPDMRGVIKTLLTN
ncbi:hypothetical protein GIB67_041286 [Kingdonia uniflora]|uniref:Protein kinase domain-containing protein n=1 Tax=Kingdonia uniflora TaxID=39325 RepID=A0A7J7NIF4_9MAGN|nr:hypothetical protein GIB67_041286 [Kingdonia uniflora]